MTHKQLYSLFIGNFFFPSFFLSFLFIRLHLVISHFLISSLLSFPSSFLLCHHHFPHFSPSNLPPRAPLSLTLFYHTLCHISCFLLLPFASFIILVASCRFPFLILGDVCLFIRPSVYLLWLICLSVSLSMHTRTYIFRHKRTLTHR